MSASLETLAQRLEEAAFTFSMSGGLLTVRDSDGGRVEFSRSTDGHNDFEAVVYGARRTLLVNLITALQVYGLTANITGLSSVPKAPNPTYGGGLVKP
jgi:hypothetical protein